MKRLIPILLCGVALTPVGRAQPQTPPARPASASPGAIALAEEPYTLDTVGLSIYLPVGAVTQATRVGNQTSVQITPPPGDSTWLINLQTPRSTNLETTIQEVAEEVRDQLLDTVAVKRVPKDPSDAVRGESLGTVLEEQFNLEIGPDDRRPAARFYVRLPRGADQPAVIRGYTVFRTAPGQFVTFDLMTTEPVFQRVKTIYETTVGTATFAALGREGVARAAAVEAGMGAIAGLSSAEYEAVIQARGEQWYRLYTPAPGSADSDATELGYRRVRAWIGNRGELDAARDRRQWDDADQQPGYLLQIQGRTLVDGSIVDTIGVFFMTADRTEEAWNLRQSLRDPNVTKPRTWVETGVRAGKSMTVRVDGAASGAGTIRPLVPDEGYINQVEQFLLPQLLVRAGSPGRFAFYSYQSGAETIRMRREVLSRPEARPDSWELSSTLLDDRPPQVSIYNAAGELVRTNMADGSVWEPIALQRLVDLWKGKGLPIK